LGISLEPKIAVDSIENIMARLSEFSLTNLKTNTRIRNRHCLNEKYRDQRLAALLPLRRGMGPLDGLSFRKRLQIGEAFLERTANHLVHVEDRSKDSNPTARRPHPVLTSVPKLCSGSIPNS